MHANLKIWALHKEDTLHDLNEIRKLDHVTFYKPLAYRVQEVPYGEFGTVMLQQHRILILVWSWRGEFFRKGEPETVE